MPDPLRSRGSLAALGALLILLAGGCAPKPRPADPEASAAGTPPADSAAAAVPAAAIPGDSAWPRPVPPPVEVPPIGAGALGNDRHGLNLFRPRPLAGAIFEPARDFVARYCAACHSSQGSNRLHGRAARKVVFDSYADWLAGAAEIPGRVDRDSLRGHIMPPLSFPEQPTPEERRMIVEWVRRGSPNTPDGK